MPIVSAKKMLSKAQDGNYAVGHFNTSNLEFTQAIISAAERLNAPVMVATSVSSIKYAGYKPLSSMVRTLAKQASVPVALHLDHSPDFATVKNCVQNKWNSVMRDASHLPFGKNVAEVRKAVKYCHRRRVHVEAELGRLAGEEGWVKSQTGVFTDPLKAREFVKKTKCDSLAVSIGTSHGAYKFKDEPKLDIQRLKEIKKVVSIPLVLHGASGVPQDLIKRANRLGAKIKGARGVPDAQLRLAVKNGISKVNADTDLRLAFIEAVREHISDHPEDFNPRSILGHVRDDLQAQVEHRIKVLRSDGQA